MCIRDRFVRSAEEVKGSVSGMRAGLRELLNLCGAEISLDRETVRVYIRAYEAKEYPAVSHSSAYREAYHPAYRIVNAMYEMCIRDSYQAKESGRGRYCIYGIS